MSEQERTVLLSLLVLLVLSVDLKELLRGRIAGSKAWKGVNAYLSGLGFRRPERATKILAALCFGVCLLALLVMRFDGGRN